MKPSALILFVVLLSQSIASDTPQLPIQAPEPTPPSVLDSGAMEYTVTQATFLEASAAKIHSSGDKVLLQVQDLNPVSKVGVVLVLSNLTDPEIEVTTLIDFNGMTVGLYPPQEITPNSDGEYIVIGEPGTRYGVRAITSEGLERIYLQIEGEPEPPVPPEADLSELTEKVSISVATLDDEITQKALKNFIDEAIENLPDDLDAAITSYKEAVSSAFTYSMPKVDPPYKDWFNGFRVLVDDEMTKLEITSVTQFKAVLIAISKGL